MFNLIASAIYIIITFVTTGIYIYKLREHEKEIESLKNFYDQKINDCECRYKYVDGYSERIWLAESNSSLRSKLLKTEQQIMRLQYAGDAMAEALDALSHSYCGNEDDAELVDVWQEARRG